jgi:L-tartrate/succinate antiporter
VGLIGIVAACLLGVGAPVAQDSSLSNADLIRWGLSGFSDGTVWLIFAAFMFALGYEKTGLGRRIALHAIGMLGRRSLGLGYAVTFSDTVLAPFMPSNTARSGGTIYPIVRNIPVIYGSLPDHEPRRLGAYLVWVALASTCVTSSMFLTGLATNVLALSIMKQNGLSIDWVQWFKAFAPVGIILLLAVPLLTYLIYPPTSKTSEEAPRWAAGELDKLGPLSRKEITMGLLAILALVLWIFGEKTVPAILKSSFGLTFAGLNATTVALLVLVLMTLTGVITWDDILGNKQAWNVLAWFATLVALSAGLKNVGFLKWFADQAVSMLQGFSPFTVTIGLLVLFYLAHYFFASSTAHAAALLSIFLMTAKATPGIDTAMTGLLLCLSFGIMGIITPYGTGPSPIWYGTRYVKPGEFWLLGAVFGAIFLLVFLFVGVPWIRWIGI